jgi:hypothetical protein
MLDAEHVNDHALTPDGEEALAIAWNEKGLLSNIAWFKAGEVLRQSDPPRHITMTSNNEALRFFEAGRWVDGGYCHRAYNDMDRKIIIRHKAPLIQCIYTGLQKRNDPSWVIIS